MLSGMDTTWRMAITATRHCLTGCAIGEILGMLLTTWWGWGTTASIVLSIVLAFFFGYLLTFTGVRRAGADPRTAAQAALASDTVSILTMEVVDNVFLLFVPGAMAATLDSTLFWWSLAVSLAVAFVAAVPVNHWLMARGQGHAVVHRFHEQHAHPH
jgi:Zn-dependent protease